MPFVNGDKGNHGYGAKRLEDTYGEPPGTQETIGSQKDILMARLEL